MDNDSKVIFNLYKESNILIEEGIMDSITGAYNKIKEFGKNLFSFPVHVRALLMFLMGNTEVFGADKLKPEEAKFLADAALEAKKTTEERFFYPFWNLLTTRSGGKRGVTGVSPEQQKRDAELAKQGKVSTNLVNVDLPNQFKYFIGETDKSGITIDGNNVTVKDLYDFNGPEDVKMKLQNSADALKNYMKGDATLYNVIRQLVTLRQNAGYKGFPVSITLPLTQEQIASVGQQAGNQQQPQQQQAPKVDYNKKLQDIFLKYRLKV